MAQQPSRFPVLRSSWVALVRVRRDLVDGQGARLDEDRARRQGADACNDPTPQARSTAGLRTLSTRCAGWGLRRSPSSRSTPLSILLGVIFLLRKTCERHSLDYMMRALQS